MDISGISSGAAYSHVSQLQRQAQPTPAPQVADNDGDEATESAAQKAAERGGVDIRV